ncbi:unnamed protein product [Arctia plantaginis]|uniref:Uncharacterized protein n=1 Tax=Arctia plantaginis TaxID=874455 RepID=A0A8S0ZYV0_ARCPL|nr:unnamed protein product [Arctia plantaginis]
MLLNGVSREVGDSVEIDDGKEPVLSGGIWKCGNCDGIDETKLMYSEINEIEDKMMTDSSVNIQIAFTLPGMQCITIHSETPGVVRRITGACTSGTLTLSVASVPYFTVNIYG